MFICFAVIPAALEDLAAGIHNVMPSVKSCDP